MSYLVRGVQPEAYYLNEPTTEQKRKTIFNESEPTPEMKASKIFSRIPVNSEQISPQEAGLGFTQPSDETSLRVRRGMEKQKIATEEAGKRNTIRFAEMEKKRVEAELKARILADAQAKAEREAEARAEAEADAELKLKLEKEAGLMSY